MTCTLVLHWVGLLALQGAPDVPRDPATLHYVELATPTPVIEPVFSDLPATPDDETWLATQKAECDRLYGSVDSDTGDLSVPDIHATLQRVSLALAKSPTFATPNGELMRASLQAERVKLDSELASLTDAIVPATFGSRLNVTQSVGTQFNADIIYFRGTDQQVMFRATVPAPAGGTKLVYYATSRQAFEFGLVAGRMFAMAAQVRGRLLGELRLQLARLNEAWDNYLVRGFSQFPWESYVNAYGAPHLFGRPSWYDPPSDQLVILHPDVGVLVDPRSRSSADVEMALFVDAIGYIHYFGDDRDWFLGVSAAISLSNDDVGLGVGPMVHFGGSSSDSQLPNISVGMFWHEPDDGRDGFLIGTSIDLLRLFDKTGPKRVLRSALGNR